MARMELAKEKIPDKNPNNMVIGTTGRMKIFAKGAIKDTAGKITGDTKMQTEGKIDKLKGDVHNVAGDVKDAARDATK